MFDKVFSLVYNVNFVSFMRLCHLQMLHSGEWDETGKEREWSWPVSRYPNPSSALQGLTNAMKNLHLDSKFVVNQKSSRY
jgi:hypothetical protein